MVIREKIDRVTAQQIGAKLNVDFERVGLDEFRDALNVEIKAEINEGEIKKNENLPDDELTAIGRITIAHLNPFYD